MSRIAHQKILLKSLIGEEVENYCEREIGKEEAQVLKGGIKDNVKEWFLSNEASFRREDRTELEFAQALVIDKIVLHWLKKYFETHHNINLALNGCDKLNALIVEKVTCAPDFVIENQDIYIEEITSYSGTIKETGALHLRNYKGQFLKKIAKTKKVYILVFDVPTRTYAFVEMKNSTPLYAIKELEKFGSKNGYGLDIGDYPFVSLNEQKGGIHVIKSIA